MPPGLTRGGRKLEAALAAFGLAERVRGARAIDVGASAGGFVSVLLAGGAAHVTAVDVGHGQLAPELATDARVASLERTDFKTLSLAVAPGPFDFFTVDVSFVAGRSMLRGLAFRLRPGAEGVVLVKPQFELPSRLVKDGQVGALALRQRALAGFVAKAERLGFAVLATVDSPVPGGSGTVEILAHLRFVARPASMPQPGERKRGTSQSSGRSASGTRLEWFAVASPGLEGVLRAELAALPEIVQPREVPGGVAFSGSLRAGMAANLCSRIATRVLVRVGEVQARDFAPLRRRLASLPWASFVPTDRPLRIEVSTSHCRLYHTGALAETVALAIEDRVGQLPAREPRAGGAEDFVSTRILLRGQDDGFQASVDASGELLHRRGWRVEAGPAPLRETLAAGLLALAEHDPALPLVDPMCGAGTIAIEAAALAQQRPPGSGRGFAFERWPVHDAETWRQVRDLAAAPGRAPAPIVAADHDDGAVAIARRNAERAQVDGDIEFRVASFGQGELPATPGLVVLNPPYGHRLGQGQSSQRLARSLGQTLGTRFRAWRAAVLCPDAAFVAAVSSGVRQKPLQTFVLRNGGLRVQLALWRL